MPEGGGKHTAVIALAGLGLVAAAYYFLVVKKPPEENKVTITSATVS